MKAGFVTIFGRPNAGKSTLLNALAGEKMAIVSPKAQTTRHRIKAILTEPDYQLILSDTPGIIEPKYLLHEKMMEAVRNALEDSDVAILLFDAKEDPEEADKLFSALRLKVPAVVVINKMDRVTKDRVGELTRFFEQKSYCTKLVAISALKGFVVNDFLAPVIALLPEGEAFFPADEISDLPTRFFVGELVREKIFENLSDELPYQTTVLVREFREKTTLIKIVADIIVQRESQKAIVLGDRGSMIKKIGSAARADIEKFLSADGSQPQKVFLELFVKVKPGWRENEWQLREYGY